MPPTPDEVDRFLNDTGPDRYERLVDRLLSSPRYGERWARPWLDLCHYAAFIIRTTPFAQGITFDAPNPNEICTRRIRSNTPLQALTLLNDPVFFEMAEGLAKRVCREASDDKARIDWAFRLCVSRHPTAAESSRLQELLDSQRNTETASDHKAWTIVCSVLLNLHEFIMRD